jgi:hypothetical protein
VADSSSGTCSDLTLARVLTPMPKRREGEGGRVGREAGKLHRPGRNRHRTSCTVHVFHDTAPPINHSCQSRGCWPDRLHIVTHRTMHICQLGTPRRIAMCNRVSYTFNHIGISCRSGTWEHPFLGLFPRTLYPRCDFAPIPMVQRSGIHSPLLAVINWRYPPLSLRQFLTATR